MVGRFTSPHFMYRWDCININNKPVEKALFKETETEIRTVATIVENELQKSGRSAEKVTNFEILTATAFTLFDKAKCDVAIIECGLGGKLDATNALPDEAIACSIITSISLDHVDMLGGSIDSIIEQKLGIVRRDVPVVVAQSQDLETLRKIFAVLEKQQHKFCPADNEMLLTESSHIGTRAVLEDLLPHQLGNLATAHLATTLSVNSGLERLPAVTLASHVDQLESLPDVLEDAANSYPGRLQLLRPQWSERTLGDKYPTLINLPLLLDGAHNEDSAKVLRAYVSTRMPRDKPAVWILAFSAGKDISLILRVLIKPKDRVIFTRFGIYGPVDGMSWVRSAALDDLQNYAGEADCGESVIAYTNDLRGALQVCEAEFAKDKRWQDLPNVVIAGSLYLVSDFLRLTAEGSDSLKD
ncbi:hypothetical protein LTR66_014468 [Elasticomyces elasticus]|nr:hypothetical protein LTR66_014468 [Elasticomyces elasticus]